MTLIEARVALPSESRLQNYRCEKCDAPVIGGTGWIIGHRHLCGRCAPAAKKRAAEGWTICIDCEQPLHVDSGVFPLAGRPDIDRVYGWCQECVAAAKFRGEWDDEEEL